MGLGSSPVWHLYYQPGLPSLSVNSSSVGLCSHKTVIQERSLGILEAEAVAIWEAKKQAVIQ